MSKCRLHANTQKETMCSIKIGIGRDVNPPVTIIATYTAHELDLFTILYSTVGCSDKTKTKQE